MAKATVADKKQIAETLRSLADYIESEDVQLLPDCTIQMQKGYREDSNLHNIIRFPDGCSSIRINLELYNKKHAEQGLKELEKHLSGYL